MFETLSNTKTTTNNKRTGCSLVYIRIPMGIGGLLKDTVWIKKEARGYCGTTLKRRQATAATTNKTHLFRRWVNTVGISKKKSKRNAFGENTERYFDEGLGTENNDKH